MIDDCGLTIYGGISICTMRVIFLEVFCLPSILSQGVSMA